MLAERAALPLYVGPSAGAVAALYPSLVVDARMRRGLPAERQRGEAPLVVGLGPGLRAGEHADVVVETCPGPDLGRALWHGAALAHVPLQRPAGAAGIEHYVHASTAGRWRTARAIGSCAAGRAVIAVFMACFR